MVKSTLALLALFASVACTPPRPSPRPIAEAPIGIDASAPASTAPAGSTPPSAASGAGEAEVAPDPTCAVPTKCATTGAEGLFSIALERTACFGTCPVYRVTIDSRGSITWQGHDYVDMVGSTTVIGDAKKARELVELALSSCFFEMKDEYTAPVTDMPWANTTVTVGNRTKTVRHYLGSGEGEPSPGICSAPTVLTILEKKIDELTDTARWIGKGGAK